MSDKTGIDQLPDDKSNLTDMIQISGPVTSADPFNTLAEGSADVLLWPDEEEIDWPRGTGPGDGDSRSEKDETIVKFEGFKGNRSLMNDYHVINLKGPDNRNYPKTEEESGKRPDLYKNLTATDLIKNPVGASIYKPSDFLYCSRYGMIPTNRMITLRRFAFPVLDDIFTKAQLEPDIARMVSYMDADINPMSEILKFSWGMRWKDLQAAAQTVSMSGSEEGTSNFMRKIMDHIDPKRGREAMLGDNRLEYNPLHDQNKVYGPVDSIVDTKIREVGLNFNFEVNLTFDYTVRSINGVNGKAAMMDIISNALAATMNNGKFWGGARHWVGRRPSQFLKSLKFMHARDFDEFLKGGMQEIRGLLGRFGGSEGKDEAIRTLKQIAVNALNMQFGKIMDSIGRPSIPVFDSLLKNEPLGEWHLTVGNPNNPILAIGNLIVKNTSFEVDPEALLSYDDQPTKIRITVTLEPHMPRDKAGIESMFNAGRGRTYWKPKDVLKVKSNPSKGRSTSTDPTKALDRYVDGAVNAFGQFKDVDIKRNFKGVYDFLRDPDKQENSKYTGENKQRAYPKAQSTKNPGDRSQTGVKSIDKDKSELGN